MGVFKFLLTDLIEQFINYFIFKTDIFGDWTVEQAKQAISLNHFKLQEMVTCQSKNKSADELVMKIITSYSCTSYGFATQQSQPQVLLSLSSISCRSRGRE